MEGQSGFSESSVILWVSIKAEFHYRASLVTQLLVINTIFSNYDIVAI